ncbi:hypothetical protein [Arthrobacter sp. MDT1-65]
MRGTTTSGVVTLVAAGFLLAGCGAPAIDAATAGDLQAEVRTIASTAAAGDPAEAIALAQNLKGEVDAARTAGTVTEDRASEIGTRLDAVIAALEAGQAPADTATTDPATQPPAEEPTGEAPAPVETDAPAPQPNPAVTTPAPVEPTPVPTTEEDPEDAEDTGTEDAGEEPAPGVDEKAAEKEAEKAAEQQRKAAEKAAEEAPGNSGNAPGNSGDRGRGESG